MWKELVAACLRHRAGICWIICEKSHQSVGSPDQGCSRYLFNENKKKRPKHWSELTGSWIDAVASEWHGNYWVVYVSDHIYDEFKTIELSVIKELKVRTVISPLRIASSL